MLTRPPSLFGATCQVCALLLHPEEYIGDRAAVLFIAFLILVTNMQVDLGLGVVSELLWVDVFNLVQVHISPFHDPP